MSATTATHAFTASADDRRRCTCGKSRNVAAHGYDAKARAAAKATPADEAAVLEAASAALLTQPEPAAEELPETDTVAADLEEAADLPDLEAVRAELLPAVAATVDDAELADAMEAAGIPVETPEERIARSAELSAAIAASPSVALLSWSNPAAKTPAPKTGKQAPAAKPAADAEPVKTIWVGWRIAERIMASDAPELSTLAAKLTAKKPTKLLDRYVRLTRAESEALSAVATEVENGALDADTPAKERGPLAYSARTLRGRIATAWA